MGGKPLELDWEDLLPGGVEESPVDVVAVSDRMGERQAPEAMTDLMLADKIARLRKHLASDIAMKLKDRGGKLKSQLRSLEEERERRSLVVSVDVEDDEECKDTKQMPRRRSPDSLNYLSSKATTSSSREESFTSCFNNILDKKVNHGNRDAHKEELSIICKDLSNDSVGLDRKRNKQRWSSRTSSFDTLKTVANRVRQKSCQSQSRSIAISSAASPHKEDFNVVYFSKRRKSPESSDSLKCNLTKVNDVVLLDEEAQRVEQQWKGDENVDGLPSSNETKFYFPSRDHPECVELCHSDLKCLEPESYLSSNIMNFYILYLQRTVSSSGRPGGEYHFCNTYFYSKIEEVTSQKGEVRKHFTKLRRWWKGVNLFEKAYIFLPIHGDLHWSLVIICIPAKEDESGPIILHLDSLRFHLSGQILDNVERYLKEEWIYMEKTARPLDLQISESIWKNLPRRIDKKRITVPQQKNDYDCGLFVLYFIERFIEAAPARLRREDLAMFGRKWFDPEEASGLRQRLRDLLKRLFQISTEEPPDSP